MQMLASSDTSQGAGRLHHVTDEPVEHVVGYIGQVVSGRRV